MKIFPVFFLWLFLFVQNVLAWPAQVLNVYDGDTITVAPCGDEESPVFVCLYGIDAPDLKQDYGQEAKTFLAAKIKVGSQIEVIPFGIDGHGRVQALIVRNGKVINGDMVSNGFAWVSQKCQAMLCRRWMGEQKKAHEGAVGLWKNSSPESPWAWKKKNDLLPLAPVEKDK